MPRHQPPVPAPPCSRSGAAHSTGRRSVREPRTGEPALPGAAPATLDLYRQVVRRAASIGALRRPFKRAAAPVSLPQASARYLQVKHFVLERIAGGTLRAGERVPSENELVRQLAVSRMTANRALKELAADGVLVRVAGRRHLRRRAARARPPAGGAQHRRRDPRPRPRVPRARGGARARWPRRASSPSASRSSPARRSTTPCSRTSRAALPLQVEERYVNPLAAPGYLRNDFTRTTPHEFLIRVAPLQRAEHTVRALVPGAAHPAPAEARGRTRPACSSCAAPSPRVVSRASPTFIIPVRATSSPRTVSRGNAMSDSSTRMPLRAPRGPQLSCRSWLTEAPLRMLMNNLDPEVAERPAGARRLRRHRQGGPQLAVLRADRGGAARAQGRRDAPHPVGQAGRGIPHPRGCPARAARQLQPRARAGPTGSTSTSSTARA